MLPSLSARLRRVPRPRLLAGAGSAMLVAASLIIPEPALPSKAPAVTSVAERLSPSTWAFAVPIAWLAAPLVDPLPGDRIDLLALRAGERPVATAIAFDLEVMRVDERTLVVSVTAQDATAIAVARAGGQSIIPLLRSTR